MSKIKFGTDGWRALMDTDFTPENVDKVAQAFADFMNAEARDKDTPCVVIGYDWRKNSEVFAKSVADVLVGNGIQALLSSEACPTPAVSYAVVDGKCSAGVII